MSVLCKNCGKKCLSTYCSKLCNYTYIHKTKWVITNCLTCGKEIESRISRKKLFCSITCSSLNPDLNKKKIESMKLTCIKKYGVDSVMKTEFGKNNLKASLIKKYGVDSYFKTPQFKKKFISTCQNKYGVDYPQQSDKIRTKSRLTVNRKYGGFSLASPILREKIRNTMIERYGVDNALKSHKIKLKQQQTNIERYGDITPLTNDKIKCKTSKTLNEKYGVKNISQLSDIKQTVKEKNNIRFMNYLFDGNRLEHKVIPMFRKDEYRSTEYNITYPFECITCKCNFNDNLYSGHIPRCPTCFPLHISMDQIEIYEFIKSLFPCENILQNDRNILPSGLELDIYVTFKKIAIEYDGLYWHSETHGGKQKQYHLTKTTECELKGIQLLHIWDWEWINKKEIIKSIILDRLGLGKTIGIEGCIIKEVGEKDKNKFLEDNHLDGRDRSSIKLGLYNNDELVYMMTFSKSRFDKGYEYELCRCAAAINTTIAGGAEKLFSHFVQNYNPKSIVSYCDRRYFDGKVYSNIGMNLISTGDPTYHYFHKSNCIPVNRLQFQKHKLSKKLSTYDSNLTEWQNMQLNGYDRIWDCGNFKYEWKAIYQ